MVPFDPRKIAGSGTDPIARANRVEIFSGTPVPQVTIKRSRLRDVPQRGAERQNCLEEPAVTGPSLARVHRVEASSQSPGALIGATVALAPLAQEPAIQHGLRAAKRAVRKPKLIRAETLVPEVPAELAEHLRHWDFSAPWAQEQYQQLQARANELQRQIEEAKRAPGYPEFLPRSRS